MNREQKAATIEALATEIEGADAVFAVDYRGISVPQAAELRTKLRDADATFRVVKNSLTERAADQAGADALKALLQGPTALTFVRGDAALAAKAIADYARATQLLPFKGGLMDGDTLDAEQVRSISRLPSRHVLYGQLVGVVASPVTGLVRTLNALIGGLAVALGQVHDKKASGEIAAADAPDAPETAAEPETADALQTAASDPPPEGESAQAASEESPPEEVEDSPVSDEAPAGEADPEGIPGEPVTAAASEPEAGAGPDQNQAEPEATPDTNDNQADASA